MGRDRILSVFAIELGGDLSGDGDRAMFATGATNCNRHILLSLLQISGEHLLHHCDICLHKITHSIGGKDVVINSIIQAREWSKLRDPMWIRNKAAIEYEIGIYWDSIFITE
jgi:hypothetical protein